MIQKKSEESINLLHKKEEEATRIDRVLKAAEKLASREDDQSSDGYFFEISDQNGNRIQLPTAERKALVLGLSLHENGRKKLKDGDVTGALDLLLASDKSLSTVNSEVLSSTDNYGLLCLDIAWCYFITQNLDFLTDAAWRLHKAEECFIKSYGANQERLISLKGEAAPELVIYIRLDLLKSVVAYHQGNFSRAKSYLATARERLDKMYIQDDETLTLISMGFEPRECRIALRTCQRNFDRAAQWLIERREQKTQQKEERRRRNKEERQQRRWGKTKNGNWVNLATLADFVAMGFQEDLAAEALKQADNSRDNALNVLLTQPDILRFSAEQNYRPTPMDLDYIESMGFSRQDAERALKQTMGALDAAVSTLVGMGFPMPQATSQTLDGTLTSTDGFFNAESTPTDAPAVPDNTAETEATRRARELEAEAEQEIISGLADEDEHLDVNLEREMDVLKQYEALLHGK